MVWTVLCGCWAGGDRDEEGGEIGVMIEFVGHLGDEINLMNSIWYGYKESGGLHSKQLSIELIQVPGNLSFKSNLGELKNFLATLHLSCESQTTFKFLWRYITSKVRHTSIADRGGSNYLVLKVVVGWELATNYGIKQSMLSIENIKWRLLHSKKVQKCEWNKRVGLSMTISFFLRDYWYFYVY